MLQFEINYFHIYNTLFIIIFTIIYYLYKKIKNNDKFKKIYYKSLEEIINIMTEYDTQIMNRLNNYEKSNEKLMYDFDDLYIENQDALTKKINILINNIEYIDKRLEQEIYEINERFFELYVRLK